MGARQQWLHAEFCGERDGPPIVSVGRLYLDLLATSGDVAQQPERVRFVSALTALAGLRQCALGQVVRLVREPCSCLDGEEAPLLDGDPARVGVGGCHQRSQAIAGLPIVAGGQICLAEPVGCQGGEGAVTDGFSNGASALGVFAGRRALATGQ